MNSEAMRTLIGYVLLCAMLLTAAAYILVKNRSRIRELCTDENGNTDLLLGLERLVKKESAREDAESPEDLTPDGQFMTLIMRQKGAGMQDFDPEKSLIREHIIFRGRVQGVGFRYQATYAARDFGLTGWVQNLPDGSVEMEAQGTPAAIGRMMKHLGSGHWIRIDDMDMEEMPLVPDERGFDVRGY